MHEDHIGIAPPPGVERLASAQGHDAHIHTGGLLECRQQMPEEPRLLSGRGRGHHDEAAALGMRLRMAQRSDPRRTKAQYTEGPAAAGLPPHARARRTRTL